MAQEEGTKWTSLIIALVILLALGWFVGTREARVGERQEQTGEQVLQTEVLKTVSYEGQDGKTALELLQMSHQTETQQSDLGVLVTKIDGVGGEQNTYWLYYVNGEAAEMGPDKFVTASGQQIEWRYERF